MDNKALVVTLVVVFVGGLVLGSASFGGFSGQVVKNSGSTYIRVTPSVVQAGSAIDLSISPVDASCKVTIYRISESGVESKADVFEYARGQGSTCNSGTTYSYAIPMNFRGLYEARVYNSFGSGYSSAQFRVV